MSLLLLLQSRMLLIGVSYTPTRSKCQDGRSPPRRSRSSGCSRSSRGRHTTSPSSCGARCTSSGLAQRATSTPSPSGSSTAGLAEAREEWNGNRRRTVYSITDRGRAALREWLATPPAPARVESEAHLRLLYANYGSKDDLLRTIQSIEDDAQRTIDHYARLATEYAHGEGLFPDRIHVNALVASLSIQQARAAVHWARFVSRRRRGMGNDRAGRHRMGHRDLVANCARAAERPAQPQNGPLAHSHPSTLVMATGPVSGLAGED